MKVTGYPSIDKPHEKGYSHFAKNPIIPNMSVYNILKLINVFNGNEQAINCLNLNVTYNELIKDVDTLAKAFKELGIKANDIIPVCMPNLYQELVCFLAANKIGSIITFLNYQSTIEEIKYYLNMFSSPLFINYDKDREYNEIIKNGTKVRQIITLNKNDINLKRFTTIDNMSMGIVILYHLTRLDHLPSITEIQSIPNLENNKIQLYYILVVQQEVLKPYL